jgi:MurNAc alpha-1-phosphate uridylyltransferase
MDPAGRLVRRPEREVVPFVYAGAAILHPRLLADAPAGPFSLNLLFNRAMEAGRLFGVRLDGLWFHVGTPDAIGEAEMTIADSAA